MDSMGRAMLVVMLGACGFQHGSLGDPRDDSRIDTPTSDGDDAAPDAIGMGPWGNVTMVIPGSGDDDPTLTADLLELYFNRTGDIYVVRRSAIGQPWSTPARVDEVSDAVANETTPEITSDGLVMFLGSTRTGTVGASDVWMSKRNTRNDPWGTPVRIAALSSPTENAASAPTDDLLTIVQIGNPNGTDSDLYASARATTSDTWSMPLLIPGANSSANDFSPMLTQDTLTLYFDSNRINTDHDLFVATRSPAAMSFPPPQVITELQTDAQETDPWISPDGRHLFFVRDAVLFEASR